MRGSPDAARFDVYRNNVMVSLIGALEQKFPVCAADRRRGILSATWRALIRQADASRPRR